MYLGINSLYTWIFTNGRAAPPYSTDKTTLHTHNVAPSSGIVDNWTYTRFWVYVFLLYSEVFMHCFLHQYNDAYLRTK